MYDNIGLCISILFTGIFLILGFIGLSKEKKSALEQQGRMIEQEQLELERKKQTDSYLSAANILVESVIRDHLKNSYTNEWGILKDDLEALYIQSLKMDDFQEKLKDLITKNDASILDDTEEVLEQAEQGLLRNIRKVMNYMAVCDVSVDSEVSKVRNSALECFEENKKIIMTVSDFIMSLTEYLNNQGSTDNLATLNTYKEALKTAVNT